MKVIALFTIVAFSAMFAGDAAGADMKLAEAVKSGDVSLLGDLLPTQQDVEKMRGSGSISVEDGLPPTAEAIKTSHQNKIVRLNKRFVELKFDFTKMEIRQFGLFNAFGPWEEQKDMRPIPLPPSMCRIDYTDGVAKFSVVYKLMRLDERKLLASVISENTISDQDWPFILRWRSHVGDNAADDERACKIIVGLDVDLTEELFGYWRPGSKEHSRVFSRDHGNNIVLYIESGKVVKAETTVPNTP